MSDSPVSEQKSFVIASRYQVRPMVNAVFDIATKTQTRVEPRLMKLLCILSEESRMLVTRERLVKEIWDDYGGGEEGLTHAISSLRKILNDASRTLIETVPKKGYILQAEITRSDTNENPPQDAGKKRQRSRAVYVSVFLLSAMLLVGLIYFLAKKDSGSTPQSNSTELGIAFNDAIKQFEETRLNTIVTVGGDGTHYKLKARGDGRPELFINGKLLSPDEMENYLTLINNLSEALKKRNER